MPGDPGQRLITASRVNRVANRTSQGTDVANIQDHHNTVQYYSKSGQPICYGYATHVLRMCCECAVNVLWVCYECTTNNACKRCGHHPSPRHPPHVPAAHTHMLNSVLWNATAAHTHTHAQFGGVYNTMCSMSLATSFKKASASSMVLSLIFSRIVNQPKRFRHCD